MLCLVEGSDYIAVNMIQTVNSMVWCMSVYIINDAIPEMNETFTVSLFEVSTTTDGCANMTDNSSIDNGSGSGNFGHVSTMLEPMEPIFSETAIITIVDDDTIVADDAILDHDFIGELVLCVQ